MRICSPTHAASAPTSGTDRSRHVHIMPTTSLGCPWSLEFGIKHAADWSSKRSAFERLLRSIRRLYTCTILVNIDGEHIWQRWPYNLTGIREVGARNTHLGGGRNELVRASRAKYLLIMDDDVVFTDQTNVTAMMARMPGAEVVLGCYNSASDCFQHKFAASESHGQPALQQRQSTLGDAHIGHNFLLVRPANLIRSGWLWDNRSFMMEHEIFFLRLWYAGRKVVIASDVIVQHGQVHAGSGYLLKSLRHKEEHFLSYLCIDFPSIGFFELPYIRLNCTRQTFCQRFGHTPYWYGNEPCRKLEPVRGLPWLNMTGLDQCSCEGIPSKVRFAISSSPASLSSHFPNALQPVHTRAKSQSAALRFWKSLWGARAQPQEPIHVPLLVLIFTQASNVERRSWQRETWLRQKWVHGELVSSTNAPSHRMPSEVNWRYVYVQARQGGWHNTDEGPLDVVHGDVVTLSAVREGYANLVYKTLESLRWALDHVAFKTLIKTDDDSMVHIGRVAMWLHNRIPSVEARAQLYGGRIFNDSQIIRPNTPRSSLLHPDWYPADFLKWAVPYEAYSSRGMYIRHEMYPAYCSGGGYLLGRKASRRIVAAYDARKRRRSPIVAVEDAFVGILAEESGLKPTDMTPYVQDTHQGSQDPAFFAGKMIVHRIKWPIEAFEWLTDHATLGP